MQLLSATLLAMLATLAIAAPASETNVVSREEPAVTLCPARILVVCVDFPIHPGKCEKMPYYLSIDLGKITVPKGYKCTLYEDEDCKDVSTVLGPGLTEYDWQDSFVTRSSYRCERTT